MKFKYIFFSLLAIASAIITYDIYKVWQEDYTEETMAMFRSMPAPVILQYKEYDVNTYSVAVRDGKGRVKYFGSVSEFANYVGKRFEINDTLKPIGLNCCYGDPLLVDFEEYMEGKY